MLIIFAVFEYNERLRDRQELDNNEPMEVEENNEEVFDVNDVQDLAEMMSPSTGPGIYSAYNTVIKDLLYETF